MIRLSYVTALVLAFAGAFAVGKSRPGTLAAQGVLCNCTWQTGTGGNFVSCLGTGKLNNSSCSQIGTQCFIGGVGSWKPAPVNANCVLPGPNTGLVQAIAAGAGGPSCFTASSNASPPWGVISLDCGSPNNFGAQMVILHNTWTGTCVCNSGTASTAVAAQMWTCGP